MLAMMRRSQAIASDRPAPAAAPGNDAIVGLGIENSFPDVARWLTRWRWIAPSIVLSPTVPSPRAAMALTSPPPQKPLPAPVRTMHLTAGSSSAFASCSPSAAVICPDMALRASGRFIVSVRTPSSNDASRSVVPVSICPAISSRFLVRILPPASVAVRLMGGAIPPAV